MNLRAQIALLPDERRLHLQDGPIDLIVEGFGHSDAVRAAYGAAAARFVTILDELCAELPMLRSAASPHRCALEGAVARRMHEAVAPFAAERFITPMAAVAGAVAEEMLSAMVAAAPLARAYVNNGGDIALHLAPGATFTAGMIGRLDHPAVLGTATIDAADPVRGIATSGWRGRSFSLGIADAVTVLAHSAARADAAATVIANEVDLPGHPGIRRMPASGLQPDSDLGDRLVTVDVEPLMHRDIAEALDHGTACAEALLRRGLIHAASVHLQGETATVGLPSSPAARPFLSSIEVKAVAHG